MMKMWSRFYLLSQTSFLVQCKQVGSTLTNECLSSRLLTNQCLASIAASRSQSLYHSSANGILSVGCVPSCPSRLHTQHQQRHLSITHRLLKYNKNAEAAKAAAVAAATLAEGPKVHYIDVYTIEGADGGTMFYGAVTVRQAKALERWAEKHTHTFSPLHDNAKPHPSIVIVTAKMSTHDERHHVKELKKSVRQRDEKRIKCTSGIDRRDLQIKVNHIADLLEKGHPVRMDIRGPPVISHQPVTESSAGVLDNATEDTSKSCQTGHSIMSFIEHELSSRGHTLHLTKDSEQHLIVNFKPPIHGPPIPRKPSAELLHQAGVSLH